MAAKFNFGKTTVELADGSKVIYETARHTVSVQNPQGNILSIIHVAEDYTVEAFSKYCDKIAQMMSTMVYPWQNSKQISIT